MKVYFNDFAKHVQSGRANCYLIIGEEPWQRIAAGDMVRDYARQNGYARRLFFAGAGFDPHSITRAAQSGSLFDEQRTLIDLRIDAQVSASLGEVIRAYIADAPRDALLLIQAAKADARKAWVKDIAAGEASVLLTVYNKTGGEFQSWLRERIEAERMTFERDAEDLFAMRVDGNLPAAANALEKMRLAYGEEGAVTAEMVSSAIGDSSRYSVYDLADAVVVGDLDKSVRILHSLKADNIALPFLLWALVHKIKSLADAKPGAAPTGPPNSRRAMRVALKRKVSWQGLLHRCAEVDEAVKSADAVEAWNAVRSLVLRVCGVKIGLRN